MNALAQGHGSRNTGAIQVSGSLYQAVQAKPKWPERPVSKEAIFEGFERQMAEFASQHDTLLAEIRKHYLLPPDSSVQSFLTEHRSLPALVLQALPGLRVCFGPQAIIALRAPIDASGDRILYGVVQWAGSARDAKKALQKFDDTWWISRSHEASGHLTFTYELV